MIGHYTTGLYCNCRRGAIQENYPSLILWEFDGAGFDTPVTRPTERDNVVKPVGIPYVLELPNGTNVVYVRAPR